MLDSVTKKTEISNQVNFERMKNNPVNLDPFKSLIFGIG